jgi:hypothetical protein
MGCWAGGDESEQADQTISHQRNTKEPILTANVLMAANEIQGCRASALAYLRACLGNKSAKKNHLKMTYFVDC